MIRGHPTLSTVRRFASSVQSGRLALISKAYNPIDFETKTLEKWSRRKRPVSDSGLTEDKPTFRMIFPPPNVTGKLHLGHALTVAIQDTIVRLKLMRGHNVEWIPGFDHAGIATHSVVTRKLTKSGQTTNPEQLRFELETHASINRENIRNQLTALGALLDWDREYYTLDENHSFVVKEAFMQLFESGIIRRGQGMVNWSFVLRSSVADIEVDDIEFKGRQSLDVPGYSRPVEFGLLYHYAYPVQDSKTKLVVATSRPETMFGDVAIAVNPSDEHNSEYIGKSAINPINGKLVRVIADSRVRQNFGTGLVKITPAHDKLDFTIGIDHKLPFIKVFDDNGNMNENCGEYQGMPRFLAREKIISNLKDSGALIDVKDYAGSIGICSRTQDIIEPLVHPHWFFQTESFSDIVIDYIKKGELVIRPESMQNAFLHHLLTMHDWCLSRQIQWGHQIPAYYHQSFPEEWVTASCKSTAIKKLREKLGIATLDEDKVQQDKDVLDTWFSSALIPLSVSNWPDVDHFHEISLMETGHDILLFWVWRMLIMNLALAHKLPFRSVLLHGIVVDNYGRKMSKSKGNVLDPMHVIEGRDFKTLNADATSCLESGELNSKEFTLRVNSLEKDYPNGLPACGADALRFALLGQDILDQNLTISLDYLENCKHFCNKLWQAMRLYLHYQESSNSSLHKKESEHFSAVEYSALPMMDRWILASLFEFVKTYETNVRTCKFHLVTEGIRTFFYSQYCDVYLEFAKLELKKGVNVVQHLQVMHNVLCLTIKMVHPFLPFVTEEIWSVLTEDKDGLLIDSKQPLLEELLQFQDQEIILQVDKLLRLVKQVRSFKGRYFPGLKEEPAILIEIHIDDKDLIEAQSYIENQSKVKLTFDILGRNQTSDSLGIIFDLDGDGGRSCRISCLRSDPALIIPKLGDSKLLKLQTKLAKLKQQYENPAFQENAAEDAKEKLRRKLQLLQSRIDAADSETSPKQPTDSSS